MSTNIVRAIDLNIDAITFSDVRQMDKGGRLVNVQYNNGKFLMQLPTLVAPYGLTTTPEGKINLDLSLNGYDGSIPNIKNFYDKFTALDTAMVKAGTDNCKTWLRKSLSHDAVADVYTPLIRYSRDKETHEITNKYPPTIRLQIPINKDGEADIEIYDNDRNRVSFNEVNFKRAKVTAIVQITNVWLISGKFGAKLKIQQMKVSPSEDGKLNKFAFIEDPEDENDNN